MLPSFGDLVKVPYRLPVADMVFSAPHYEWKHWSGHGSSDLRLHVRKKIWVSSDDMKKMIMRRGRWFCSPRYTVNWSFHFLLLLTYSGFTITWVSCILFWIGHTDELNLSSNRRCQSTSAHSPGAPMSNRLLCESLTGSKDIGLLQAHFRNMRRLNCYLYPHYFCYYTTVFVP